MQIHQLQSTVKRRKTKYIGRGGKRGTTSGRGQKGQKARTGHKIRPAVRDLISRLPKIRGIKNPGITLKPTVLNLIDLEKKFKGVKEINKDILILRGIIKSKNTPVKILGVGEISMAINIKGLAVSKSAKEKIEKSGGKIIR